MKINFVASGNLTGLTTAMRGVNAQAAAMQGTMGRVGGSVQRVVNPYNELTDKLHHHKIGMSEMGRVMRNTEGIWKNQQRLIGASGQVMYDATGNARVMITRMGELGATTATVGQRMRVFNTFLASSSKSLVKWGKNTQWAGRQLTVGFTVPLMLLGRTASKAAEEYDRAMTRVVKVTNFSAEEGTKALDMQMESVREQTRRVTELGASWGFLAEETASTVAEFAQMGYQGAALDTLSDTALRLSFVTGSELKTAIEGTRIVAQAFAVDLNDLNEEFARLNMVENNTALSVSESVLGLPVVAAVAHTVNMSLQETNGLMAMMKNSGISAKEGATALRTGLLQLVQEAGQPTKDSFDAIGLSIDDMKAKIYAPVSEGGGGGDILSFFDQLEDHRQNIEGNREEMDKFAAALSKLFGVRQTARITSFLEQFGERQDKNTAGGRAWLGVLAETEEVMRVYAFEQRQIEESAAGIAKRLRAELNVEMTKLGEVFLEVANKAKQFAVDVVRWFNNLNDGTRKVILTIGGLLAVLGPILMLFGLMGNAIGNLLNLFTRFLPMIKMITPLEQAQAIAFDNKARAITGATSALNAHMLALGRYQVMSVGQAAGQAGAAAGLIPAAGGLAAGKGVMNPAAFGTGPLNPYKKGAGAVRLTPATVPPPPGAAAGTAARGGELFAATSKKLKSLGARFVGAIGKGLTKLSALIGLGLTKIVPGFIKKLGTTMSGALGKVGASAGVGKVAGGAKVAAGFGGAAAKAGFGALLGPLGAIAAIILAIPILADPEAFFAGFKKSFEPAFGRFMEVINRIRDSFGRVVELFRQTGGEGSGLSKIAEILGRIAGWIGGVIVDALSFVLGLVEPIMNVFEAIFHFVDMIGAIFSKDWSQAGEAFLEMAKAIARAIMSLVATIFRGIADLLDRSLIPGTDYLAGKMRDGADAMEGWDKIASNFDGTVTDLEQSMRDTADAQEEIGESLEKNTEYINDMIDAQVISEQYSLAEVQANLDKLPILQRQIRDNEQLTDEMKVRLFTYLDEIRLMEELNNLQRVQNHLKNQEDVPTMPSAIGTRIAMPGPDFEEHQKQINTQVRLEQRVLEVQQEIGTTRERAAEFLGLSINHTGELVDEMGDLVDETGDFKDGVEDAQQNLESLANTFTNAVRGEIANSMKDVATAVTESFEAEKQAAMDAFSRRMDNIKEEFSERNERMKEMFSRQKERLKEQQELVKEQLKERHELEIKRQDERHEREMDRLETRRQRERDAIEESADRRIEALQDEQEIDDARERRRERAFEREKARINYLQGMRTSNINMQLALARGELSSAAILREQMSADTANFQREGVSRERAWAVEDAKRARDEEIAMIQEVTKARLEAFDERTKAQKEALKEQQKQEQESIRIRHKMQEKALSDQQKAQDKALDARHKALEKSLKREQEIAEERIKTEQKAAEAGFDARKKAIDRTLEHWQRVTPRTERMYNNHLDNLRRDLGGAAGNWETIVDQYATNTTNHIDRGFSDGIVRARRSMGQDAKWEQFGRAMMNDLSNGVNTGLTRAFRHLADLFGVDLPDASEQRQTNYPTPKNNPHAQPQGHLSGQYHHAGGQVFGGGGQGIRADEKHAILQSGEYVVQRDAVKAMGVETMERINQAHKLKDSQYKMHSGGQVDWQKRTDSKNSMRGQGGVFGRLLSYLADHGGMPGGAQQYGSLAGLPDLVPPDSDSTPQHRGGWRNNMHPQAVQVTSAILNAIPGGQRVTSAWRPGATVAGSGRPSQHAAGKAVDIGVLARRDGGTLATEREGDAIAAAFKSHPLVSQVLWKTMTGGNHYNHVHAGFRLHEGGFADEIPDFSNMRVGKGLPRAITGTMMGHMFNRMAEAMVHSPGIQDLPGVNASGPIKQFARNLLPQFGWGEGQWPAVHNIVQRESSWNPNAQNPTSTAYGLFQFLNSTWAGVNARKTSDPYAQTRAGYQYIKNRYGTPNRAWDFWQRNHWYHSGGEVKVPQLAKGGHVNYDNVVANLHRNETVLTSDLSSKLERGINRMAAGDSFGDTIVKIENFHGTEDNIEALATRLERIYEKRDVRRGAKRRMG